MRVLPALLLAAAAAAPLHAQDLSRDWARNLTERSLVPARGPSGAPVTRFEAAAGERLYYDSNIFQLDGDWSDFTPAERALFTVAKKLAATPVVLADGDVAAALERTGPREVVQLVSYVTGRASFDRITEAAGLPMEP